jgi:hypothetical protein
MGKESIYRLLLIYLPNTNGLVIRATDHQFVISCHKDISDPLLMAMVGPCIESGGYFPELDGLVSGAGYEVITIEQKVYPADVMIVTMECLAAYVVIIQVP